MIDLFIKQNLQNKATSTSYEIFKKDFLNILNSQDANTPWLISSSPSDGASQLVYNNKPLGLFTTDENSLSFKLYGDEVPYYDDIISAFRFTASNLYFSVYSKSDGDAKLPQDYKLSLDSSYFYKNQDMVNFFSKNDFIPRFAYANWEDTGEGKAILKLYPPYFLEDKKDHSIHICNNSMLNFLIKKDNQTINQEFSYKVADSIDEFSRKHDVGLIPYNYYQNFQKNIKIINIISFDVFNIQRKVFIDPYILDFDDEKSNKIYENVENNLHLMDKVRIGESLDTAIKRVLKEELKLNGEYVGARVWGIEFDRDKENNLIPRLKLNVYVHGLQNKQKENDHDWISIN